jgi:hypothetical protein
METAITRQWCADCDQHPAELPPESPRYCSRCWANREGIHLARSIKIAQELERLRREMIADVLWGRREPGGAAPQGQAALSPDPAAAPCPGCRPGCTLRLWPAENLTAAYLKYAAESGGPRAPTKLDFAIEVLSVSERTLDRHLEEIKASWSQIAGPGLC